MALVYLLLDIIQKLFSSTEVLRGVIEGGYWFNCLRQLDANQVDITYD